MGKEVRMEGRREGGRVRKEGRRVTVEAFGRKRLSLIRLKRGLLTCK